MNDMPSLHDNQLGGLAMAASSNNPVKSNKRQLLPHPTTSIKPPVVATAPSSSSLSNSATTTNNNDKGLRHFSAKVCAKVEEKGCTSYNEVADELVREIVAELGLPVDDSAGQQRMDHKNIRRRVYDALNVLMAIDIIRKDRKEIRWLGLPNETLADLERLDQQRQEAHGRLEEKRTLLRELTMRKAALSRLINRNRLLNAPSVTDKMGSDRLHLPFILITAPRDSRVHCEMLEDRTQYFFEFDAPFAIREDVELLSAIDGGEDEGQLNLDSVDPSLFRHSDDHVAKRPRYQPPPPPQTSLKPLGGTGLFQRR